MSRSGTSTPPSPTDTLSVPSSPYLKAIPSDLRKNLSKSPLVPASTAVEYIASRSIASSTVFIYDLAEQAGFGTLTKSWAESDSETASVVSLQTRAGAGLSVAGRLSQGSSKDTAMSAVLTAYTTPTGLAAMAQSLSYIPSPVADSRLVIQVPTVTPVGESFALSPTLAPFMPIVTVLPEHFAVFLSATPQEAVDIAALSYNLKDTHVIHLFDHHSAGREVGHQISPSVAPATEKLSVKEGLRSAGYDFFDYVGDKDAQAVIVALNGPLAQAAKALAARVSHLGVVVVRVLRPWDEESLREVIPSSAKLVHVLDDVPTDITQGSLYLDVFSSLLDPRTPGLVVKPHRITPVQSQKFLAAPSSFVAFLLSIVPAAIATPSLDTPNLKKLLFFSTPDSALSPLASIIEQTFLSQQSISSHLLTNHDILSKPGGVTAERILLSPKGTAQHASVALSLPINSSSAGESDFLAVLDQALLKSHSVLIHAKRGSQVLVATGWTPAELMETLSPEALALIHERDLRFCTLNTRDLAAELIGAGGPERDAIESLLAYFAFLRLYLGKVATEALVLKVAESAFGEAVQGIELTKIAGRAWAGLVEIEVPAPTAAREVEAASTAPLKHFEFNAIAVETDDGDMVVNGARLGSWHDAAKHILFSSAFTPALEASLEDGQHPALRPEIPDRTYLVTCTVNKRLTPQEYDRNVFHLEFDTSGTGLKYEIGEALGVHGWNDTEEVLDFCSWYGVDPNRLVTIPIPGGDGRMHTRTVFQALQQQIDLFGKPGKQFYSDLAAFATRQTDKYALQFIGSPEGSSTFKKLSEKDTVTFADVLRRYASARPAIELLCELVGDIKPRHYSIASAQAVVGDQVDLLVVSVDWVTPDGSLRYGQCTRYLAGLKVGQKVTVSIKPSVMKLPSNPLQPLIMAGLGTGAAPFRAFLQYRAWLASQSIPVGPTYYYFGSRHRSQEYLYGEELEAFILDGTITKAGLAFSRDGPRKVYIQHKMLEDAQDLARMLYEENGVFYLCGPTWPVPDVYDALVGALGQHYELEPERAGEFLEGLKEEERYVLEVY